MTTEQKVALVEEARGDFGLAPALAALGLARSTWHYQARRGSYEAKYAELRAPLEAIARDLTDYGYRRTTDELRARLGRPINHKVVQRLHRLWGLPLLRSARAPKPSRIRRVLQEAGERTNLLRELETIAPLEVLLTDFTELVYAGGRLKAHLVVLLDSASKLAAGWSVGPRPTAELALVAWERARTTLVELGADIAGLIVHQDRDPAFTSYAWTSKLLLEEGVRLSYTVRGPQDNPAMESFYGRFKVENRALLLEASTLEELVALVASRMRHYNGVRRHSSLGNRSPLQFLKDRHAQT